MLDVHFDNQVLRLAHANCESGLLIKTVLKSQALCQQYFACILNHPTYGCRLVEDFQTIQDIIDDHDYYLEIKECPLKYEMFRRPTLIFKRDFTTIGNKDHHNFEANIQACLRSTCQDLRLRSRLNYALGQTWKKADFLLKTDAKLGGVLMYNSSKSSSNTTAASPPASNLQTESQIGYFIFVILSEYDLHYLLPPKASLKSSKKQTFQIIFKPKANHKSSYEYLSINKAQDLKTISLESRTDFVAWFSALRLAKYKGEELWAAFKNNHLPPSKLTASTMTARAVGPKSKFDLQKGFNQILRFKSGGGGGGKSNRNAPMLASSTTHQSLSWSESILSLSTSMNSTESNSQLSLVSSSSDTSTSGGAGGGGGNSSTAFLKKPKQACAILSDIPHHEHHHHTTDYDLEEEEDFVPMDMSSKPGGCEIITDPEQIRQMSEESALKSKYKSLPFHENWFTKKPLKDVEHLLLNNHHINGYFLVTCQNQPIIALYLNVMHNEILHQIKIIQRFIFGGKPVFSLEEGVLNFSSISSLIEFHTLNVSKPVPCYLTENPILL